MRRVVVFALLAASCRGDAAASPVAPPSPDVARPSASLLVDDVHGFEPSDDLVAAASRFGDSTGRATAAEESKTLPADRRVAVLRAGIRLRDATAARTCAGLLLWNELDDWEQGLTTRLLTDAVVDPDYVEPDGDRTYFSDFFERVSGAEMPYILGLVAAHPPTQENAAQLSILHKSASAEHLPRLAVVAVSTDAQVREAALDMMLCVTLHTDQHREDVAAALLGISVEEARRRMPDTGDGVPPLLRAVLSTKELPWESNGHFRQWAWRWLVDTRPATRDVEFLLALDAERPNDVIAWVLRDVDDPRIDPWLVATTAATESR